MLPQVRRCGGEDRIRSFSLTLFLLIFFCYSVDAQKRQQIREGLLHVKLSEGMVRQLERATFSRTADNKILTGVEVMDQVNKRFNVTNMRRLFRHGGKFEEKHRKYGLHRWYVVEVDKRRTSIRDAIPGFRSLVDVEAAEPVYVKAIVGSERSDFGPVRKADPNHVDATLPATSSDPRLAQQWHYKNEGQSGGLASADIDLLKAWQLETGTPDVIISVHDGGIDPLHDDLKNNLWTNTGEIAGNSIDDDRNGYIDDVHGFNFAEETGAVSPHDHGTHVAGTVAATTNNSIGVAGVAGGSGQGDGARVMSCAVFTEFVSGGFENSYIYAADNGAVISQNSWGYLSADFYEQSILDAIDYFIAEAGKDEEGNQIGPMNGGIVIFAAGNVNSSENFYPGYYEPVLAVAATTHEDRKAWYSNYGEWVDISAPGGETEIPEQGILSTLPGNQYGYFQGTSMACPHVSGVAALVLSRFGRPGYTPEMLRARLLTTARNIDSRDTAFAGLLGKGRLDAYDALLINDSIPPVTVSDLSVQSTGQTFVKLTWTAPFDEGEGSARIYDLRYSTSPINAGNFAQAAPVKNVRAPLPAGENDTATVDGLLPATEYYFALRSKDSNENISDLSNVVKSTTLFPPSVSFSPSTVTSSLKTGETGTGTLRIFNKGRGDLSFSFDFAEDSVGFVIPPDIDGFLESNDSTDVSIAFNAKNLRQGSYRTSLLLKTNDPLKAQVVIPVVLNVTNNGLPIAYLEPSELDFGQVFIGGASTLSFIVSNGGSEPLTISKITLDTAEFSTDVSAPIVIAPFESRTIQVTYSPNEKHETNGIISLETNDLVTPKLEVAVKGVGIEAPVITVTPMELSSTLHQNKSEEHELSIRNTGGSNLNFTVHLIAEDSFITTDTTAGTVSPGGEEKLSAVVDASGLEPGEYNTVLVIRNNSLKNDSIAIPVSLTVLPQQLSVSPDSIDIVLASGDSATQKIYVKNNGAQPTEFGVTVRSGGFTFPQGGIAQSATTSASFSQLDAVIERLRNYVGKKEKFSTQLLNVSGGLHSKVPESSSLYATDFEDFSLGAATQNGWSATGQCNIAAINPFSGSKHIRVVSQAGEGQHVSSPQTATGNEGFSTFTARIMINGFSAISEIFPISSESAINAGIQFWLDGTIFILVDDGSGTATWDIIEEIIPAGYFDLTIEIERATKKVKVFFDDRQVYEGLATGPDIIWTYSGTTNHGSGTVFDMDDVQVIDGKKTNSSFMTITPSSGTIASGATTELTLSLDTQDLFAGEYSSDLMIYNEGDKINVPVKIVVTGNPEIEVTSSVIAEADYKGKAYTNFFIENSGNAPLQYSLSIEDSLNSEPPEWMTVCCDLEGKLAAGEIKELELVFDATTLDSGEYRTNIRIVSNDTSDLTINVPVILTVLGPPQMVLTPDSVAERVYVESKSSRDVAIRNDGESPLEFSFVYVDEGANGIVNNTSKIYPSNVPMKKGQLDTRRGHPVLTGQGGPDLAGYKWIDSETPGGPVFQWIEISQSGEQLSLFDDEYQTIPLPFEFVYYGKRYNSISVGSNGFLSFEGDASWYSNMEIPDRFEPNNFIAPFWDDLFPAAGGSIYFQSHPDKVIIQYTNVPLYSDQDQANTFQIILFEDGSIILQYLEVHDQNNSTIGIENSDGSTGLQIAFNTEYVHDYLAIMIISPLSNEWVKPKPSFGRSESGESSIVKLEFDAKDLEVGNYETTLNIVSNDVETPVVPLHVALTVFDNYAPVIDSIPDTTVVETQELLLTAKAADKDDQEVVVRLLNPPSFIELQSDSNGMATYTVRPDIGQAGTYSLEIEATDGRGLSSKKTIVLTVLAYGVESFSIIDRRNQGVITTFTDSIILNRADPAFYHYEIRANTNPSSVGSVDFEIDGKKKHGSKDAPYILDYELQKLSLGAHNVTAQSFTEQNGKGRPGKALQSAIKVTYQLAPEGPPSPEQKISVYPNPVDDVLTINTKLELHNYVLLLIVDSNGRPVVVKTVKGSKLDNLKMNVSFLTTGIYYLQIITIRGERFVARLAKR